MSMDKAIASGAEHRRKYRGAKAVDSSCRNNGADPFDRSNRLYSSTKKKLEAQYSEEDFLEEDDLEEVEYRIREEHINGLHDLVQRIVEEEMK